MHRHRKATGAVSAQYERGKELAGPALIDTLSGRTLVYRHQASPGGYATDTVIYRYFRPDGVFVYVDSSTAFLNLEPSVASVIVPARAATRRTEVRLPSCRLKPAYPVLAGMMIKAEPVTTQRAHLLFAAGPTHRVSYSHLSPG